MKEPDLTNCSMLFYFCFVPFNLIPYGNHSKPDELVSLNTYNIIIVHVVLRC